MVNDRQLVVKVGETFTQTHGTIRSYTLIVCETISWLNRSVYDRKLLLHLPTYNMVICCYSILLYTIIIIVIVIVIVIVITITYIAQCSDPRSCCYAIALLTGSKKRCNCPEKILEQFLSTRNIHQTFSAYCNV